MLKSEYKHGDPIRLPIGGRWRTCYVDRIEGNVIWIRVFYTITRTQVGERTNVTGFRPFTMRYGKLKCLNQHNVCGGYNP